MGLGMFEEHNPLPTEIRPQVSALLQTPFLTLSKSHLSVALFPVVLELRIHICHKCWENKCTKDPDAQLLH